MDLNIRMSEITINTLDLR